jgi:DNA-binding response OmpR family regulator
MPVPRITIVEDEEPIRHMYSMKLQNEGFEVSIAKNGFEGLKIISEQRPDLIMLDLKMPIMDGGEMLRILRQEDWAVNIKVIILTNISKNEAPSTLRFLKIDRYVVKVHYTPKQVVEIVKEVLRL